MIESFLKIRILFFVSVVNFSNFFFTPSFAEDIFFKEEDEKQVSELQAEDSQNIASSGDFYLKQRVEDLERQVADLHVELGRLQSLLKSQLGLETSRLSVSPEDQITTPHSATLEELEQQVRELSLKTDKITQKMSRDQSGEYDSAPSKEVGSFETSTVEHHPLNTPAGLVAPEVTRSPLTEGSSGDRAIVSPSPKAEQPESSKVAALEPLSAPNDPVQEYERAYGFLIQQNYASALTGFRNFIKSHPKDPLMPHALYWLGETHYAQRNYADAAEAFDLLVQGYGNSAKAPDSLFKRGIALAALGKKADACEVLRKVSEKYPNAAATLKTKIEGERTRIGCSSTAR